MQLKIVYLDDEPDLLEIFTDEYASDQFAIRTYSNVNEAIAAIKSDPPDLIFLDYQLPGTTGDKIALSLDPGIPKYLITGNLSVKLEANFAKVLQKPIDFQAVRTILDQALGKKNS